jgi:hypothetical protein
MQDVLKELLPKLVERSDDALILDNIRSFTQYHSSGGQRLKAIQDAMDAVVTASVWPATPDVVAEEDKVSMRSVSTRLAVSWSKVKSCSERASQFIRSGEKYTPTKNVQRSDCSRLFTTVHDKRRTAQYMSSATAMKAPI